MQTFLPTQLFSSLHTSVLGTAKGWSTNGARTATCFSTAEQSLPQLEIVLGHSSTEGTWQDRTTLVTSRFSG